MAKTPFHVLLIKPTHYDDDGYPLQWHKSIIPSNSLASVHGLAEDFVARGGLGPDVDIRITSIDESNKRVQPEKMAAEIARLGGRAFVGLVGVQSNQYPHALNLGRKFRELGLPVCIGGFHVSGVLSMFDKPSPELDEATALGISMFAGEAEDGRMDEVLRDAWNGELKPIYNWLNKLPGLEGAPIPILPSDAVHRTYTSYSSFDLGRGCPFQCSFCTIINVQGRVSRYRSADDLEQIVRANRAIGIDRFMLTDDNLARNRNWEPCFDRLIELREKHGIKVKLAVQVDTLCHRIPGFIDKARRAGVDQVFIGLENVNPDNLAAAKKKQNRIGEYREMLTAWKLQGCILIAGYILGFPNDTKESIKHDIEIIKRELPLDLIYFTNLTPLPGCEDHKNAVARGEWMDPDLNKYDLNHRVTHHQRMSDKEWDEAYHLAWETFYTYDHMITVLRRAAATRTRRKTLSTRLTHFREFHKQLGVHPLEGGVFRLKYRHDRRPTLPREGIIPFYFKYGVLLWKSAATAFATFCYLRWKSKRIWADKNRFAYTDEALRPMDHQDLAHLELFAGTRGGAAALAKWEADKVRQRPRPKVIAAE
jgi:radical SAM superfamily enzyme YgiQ (UPF0313 family)